MKTLYIDMHAGLSGDMSLAGLIGLGLETGELGDMLSRLTGRDIQVSVENVLVSGISACRLSLNLPHEHAHRHLSDIEEMLGNGVLSQDDALRALKVFRKLAEAEAEIHGTTPEKIHFHEVGALDSIADIAGFCWGLGRLGIERIAVSKPMLGHGSIKCAHGIMPVPAPATLKLLEGIEVIRTDEPNEITTPTGAAIISALADEVSVRFTGNILRSTFSTGTKVLETFPNLLRMIILEEVELESVYVLNTDIDDASGEDLAGVMDALSIEGVLDISYTPRFGKKNRPGWRIEAVVEKKGIEPLTAFILERTSTAGVRYYPVLRSIMQRRIERVEVFGSAVCVKVLEYQGIIKFSPEWEDCLRASKETGRRPSDIYTAAKGVFIK
ncbi:nickel pincer cofactor biosynthesis protein LarC [Limisalsivibrio acetivorans]|uniref:nickel pincer cofactor biosynthesis protein LarC n=1 Tax=Limisalsivibrio acetivorans TaxID=1304888 RepID=UPI0003B4F6D3|nr:nickel pincer cofactor biosynthesis protein LarC [Limisalsivibrio acetivorans]